MTLSELEVAHLVETINQTIREDNYSYGGGISEDLLLALRECLEILGEPYESDD